MHQSCISTNEKDEPTLAKIASRLKWTSKAFLTLSDCARLKCSKISWSASRFLDNVSWLQGIWGGMIGGIALQTIILIGLTASTDWKKEVSRVLHNFSRDNSFCEQFVLNRIIYWKKKTIVLTANETYAGITSWKPCEKVGRITWSWKRICRKQSCCTCMNLDQTWIAAYSLNCSANRNSVLRTFYCFQWDKLLSSTVFPFPCILCISWREPLVSRFSCKCIKAT